jgi:hypothetical protein
MAERNRKEKVEQNGFKKESVVLGLEVLKKQYDTVLIQYNQAQTDYINYLKSHLVAEDEKNTKNYKEIKGKTFWGTGAISEQPSNSIEECKSMCSSDNKCTGATYNPDKSYCWIRTGDGTISDGMENDYAIIPEEISHIKIINGLSNKLTTINDKMLNKIQNEKPIYEEQIQQRKEQIKTLSNNYNKLIEERNTIKSKLRNYEDLNQAQTQGETNIYKHRSIYIFSVICLAIIIVLFLKLVPSTSVPSTLVQQVGGGGGEQHIFILFGVLILISLFVFTFSLF